MVFNAPAVYFRLINSAFCLFQSNCPSKNGVLTLACTSVFTIEYRSMTNGNFRGLLFGQQKREAIIASL